MSIGFGSGEDGPYFPMRQFILVAVSQSTSMPESFVKQ